MKVGIDTFGCKRENPNAGRYLKSLLGALEKLKIPAEEKLEIELFGIEADRYDFIPDDDSASFVSVKLPRSAFGVRLWHSFSCNSFFKKRGYDVVVFFLPERFCPFHCEIPSIAIIDDVVSSNLKTIPFFMRQQFLFALRSFRALIVPSQFVKKDLKNFHVNPDRIHVVRFGIDHSAFYPRDELEDSSENREASPIVIQRPYFVYSSKMSGKEKRHCELVRAFSLFKEKTSLPHRLVLAGGEGATSSIVAEEVPYESYPELFAGAEGFLYPAEGAGAALPVIEAMSSGIPVACSKSGALPEVSGENAIYFDSDSEESICEAIKKLATLDENEKSKIVLAGLSWASRFNWEKSASEFFEVIKSVVNGRKIKKRKN